MLTGPIDPKSARKAAMFVERLDRLADDFGVQLAIGTEPVLFQLINDTARTAFLAVPLPTDGDFTTSTGFGLGVAP